VRVGQFHERCSRCCERRINLRAVLQPGGNLREQTIEVWFVNDIPPKSWEAKSITEVPISAAGTVERIARAVFPDGTRCERKAVIGTTVECSQQMLYAIVKAAS
jgi:hypothetical protein